MDVNLSDVTSPYFLSPHVNLNLRRVLFCLSFFCFVASANAQQPTASSDLVFAEKDGLLAVEAEHFFEQTANEKRAFYLVAPGSTPDITPDGDPVHIAGASGGAYLEILPDTRRTHADKLIRGTNFSPEAGEMAVLSYKVNVTNPGRYYFWVRAYSTGSEDNGLHVGVDGTWPDSGQRLQWCEGKKTWRWDSKQRTEKQHCGEPGKIFIDIDKAGLHTIQFSMREDGFEFDKWLMTKDPKFARPDDIGPKTLINQGTPPAAFPFVAAPPAPKKENKPAAVRAKNAAGTNRSLRLPAKSFVLAGTGYYLDQGKWAAINPDKNKTAKTEITFEYPTGKYNVTLQAVGESDGQSTYQVSLDADVLGDFKCPLSTETFEEGKKFHKTWPGVMITDGTVLKIQSTIASKDGDEFSRARWAAITLTPADDATRKAAAPFLAKQPQAKAQAKSAPKSSPTKPVSNLPRIEPRQADGDGSVVVTGELKTWHKITLTLNGPYAHEQDNEPNPFTDYRMMVDFRHSDGTTFSVPGYFAADGDAGNTSAQSGTQWRAHFAPDRQGAWNYKVRFFEGKNTALRADAHAKPVSPFNGVAGLLGVTASDKTGRDLRAKGRLQYVGKRYLQHAGSKEYFLKAGADAPETLLGYVDFDNTIAGKAKKVPLKTWEPHVKDWRSGDPTWKDGKGKGLIGAVNYLAGKGCNAFSFLTYNAGGDGDNVWPFIDRDDKMHYDCSKLDQWGMVFDHGTNLGMYLHFKMQETENDDHKKGKGGGNVPECLDGGNLGPQRMLYCRELIARYGHNLALNWNLGEENTQTHQQQVDMINYIANLDAYDNNIVIHTFPGEQDKVYRPLLGDKSKLTGMSLQNSGIQDTHWQTVKWVTESTSAGKPWIVAFDESGSAAHAQCPDIGYKGFDGRDKTGKMTYTPNEVRQQTLWGQLMGGGAGVEYYFGYQFVENDLVCEDWRSRDKSWDYCRIALEFFRNNQIPVQDMVPSDDLLGLDTKSNKAYCLAKPGEIYLVYVAHSQSIMLDLSGQTGSFQASLFNPRTGEMKAGQLIAGGSKVDLIQPDAENDWVTVLRKK
ncbi:DUF5060 domain-containing protein [Stieleria marina]|uniref:DUF5060 domain-containing protein n=1 Tax=Stieleria marina TaxID=1930275 RepID=A0A517NZM4_9BACT|nr:hypothetical protein K239x_45720 [Planctomycetes bacterium K23_9]